MTFAWAPGNVVGAALGGGLAEIAGDTVAYSAIAALCILTFVAVRPRIRTGCAGGRLMRRLVLFACAVVLVDTIFFAALAPLLPRFEDELDLSKGESGCSSAMYALGGIAGAIPAGWLATRVGIKATVLAGLALLAVHERRVRARRQLLAARPHAARPGRRRRALLDWRARLARRRRHRRAARGDDRHRHVGRHRRRAARAACWEARLAHRPAAAFAGVAVLRRGARGRRAAAPCAAPREAPTAAPPARCSRSPTCLVGMWLLTLPALLFGIALRAGSAPALSARLGRARRRATFVVSAAIEATLSPAIGRWSDRRGRLAPIRFGSAREHRRSRLRSRGSRTAGSCPSSSILAGICVRRRSGRRRWRCCRTAGRPSGSATASGSRS